MRIDGIGASNMENSLNVKQIGEDQGFEEALRKAYSDGDKEKLREACKEFEGILMNMMYKQMKKTVPESELLPQSYAREVFEGMLDEEFVNNAKQTGLGVADMLYRQLSLNIDNLYKVDNKKEK